MSMVYSEEQQLLRDSAREFLEKCANPQLFRSIRDRDLPGRMDPQTWPQMVELGWASLLIPEEFEGLGLGPCEAGLIMEEMGRHLTKSPFFETAILGVSALNLSENESLQQRYLPLIANGELTCALALDEGPHFEPHKINCKAVSANGDFLISGDKRLVRNGETADLLVVVARIDDSDDPGLFLMDRQSEGLTIQPMEMVDTVNTAQIGLNKVLLPATQLLVSGARAQKVLNLLLDLANACLAAEMLGLAQETFQRTVSYLKERQQFGQAIGSFQALQHRAAHMHCELELARSVVVKALQMLDQQDPNAPALASLAKAKLCKVTRLVTNEAIQMHGGIGMTDEFDIGFFLKRARVNGLLFGDYSYHAERYARLNNY